MWWADGCKWSDQEVVLNEGCHMRPMPMKRCDCGWHSFSNEGEVGHMSRNRRLSAEGETQRVCALLLWDAFE